MQKAKEFAQRIVGDLHDANVAPTTEIEEIIEKHVRDAMEHALWCYAWMKDGVSYVGSGITTLKKAKEDL